MNRSCLLAIVVVFWLAFALFVTSAIAAPRREAEFPAQPSSGASHAGGTLGSGTPDTVGRLDDAPLPSVASQPTNAPANVSAAGSIAALASEDRS